jgi:predicted metal-dependent phosphoesterase TrpH
MKMLQSLSLGYADLHTHSIHSDGRNRPSEVVERAKGAGLKGLALTDHDSYKGIPEAIQASQRLDMELLPGVELSTIHMNREVHMLGYFAVEPSGDFLNMLADMVSRRIGRMKRMIVRLNELGCPITEAEVNALSSGDIIGRAHLFRAIRMKFGTEFDEKADSWLNVGGAAFEPTSDMTPFEAIAMILEAGGVPVIAHPGTSNADALLPELLKAGMKGIEAIYPKHEKSQTSRYKTFARKNDLFITGGSDWHGDSELPSAFHTNGLGSSKVQIETLLAIRDSCAK